MALSRNGSSTQTRFVVVGAPYSGHGVVRHALTAHPDIVCHGDLLHDDPVVRFKENAYSVFDPELITVSFDPLYISAEQYLNRMFSTGAKNEKVVGVRLPYDKIERYDLWHYLDAKSRSGDFCVLHVVRNPVSCFVREAKRRQETSKDKHARHAVLFEPEQFIYGVRAMAAARYKVDKFSTYRLVATYQELRTKPKLVADYVCPYLGVRSSTACHLWSQRRGRPLPSLVANWAQLKWIADSEIRTLMEQAECETSEYADASH